MPFIQSLLTPQGHDDRARYAIIFCACYFCFALTFALFGNNIISSLILMLTLALIATSTSRRLNDASLHRKWLMMPTLAYGVLGLAIMILDSMTLLWLLLLPMGLSAFLLTYPASQQRHYLFGYHGNIDLSQYVHSGSRQSRHRIEPVLSANVAAGSFEEQAPLTARNADATAREPQHNEQHDVGAQLRIYLLEHKKAAALALFALILMLMLLSLVTQPRQTAAEPVSEAAVVTPEVVRLHPLTLPDNFTLLLSANQGLFINWQADNTDKKQLWSQETALGDDSCQQITFNNNDSVRTLDVVVEQQQNYYASFSPLDTKTLLQAIAFRGSFKLCGYTFSLKGSQAALAKQPAYAEYIDY